MNDDYPHFNYYLGATWGYFNYFIRIRWAIMGGGV